MEFIDGLYPPRCWLCSAEVVNRLGWCSAHALDGERAAHCGRCAGPLGEPFPDGSTCAECRRSAPTLKATHACGTYRDCAALREWILAFKHAGRADLAQPLGAALARRFLASASPMPQPQFVPIPLHGLRLIERGFDQARLLADELVSALGDGQVKRALTRVRASAVQGSLGAPSRRANVRAVFAVDETVIRDLTGRDVWLVDDVSTSGATLNAAARVLKAAGVRQVSAIVLARAGC